MESVATLGRHPRPGFRPQPAATVLTAALTLLAIIPCTPAAANCLDYADHFHWLSAAAVPGISQGVAVSGTHAYLAADLAGLQIVDISNPSAPVLVGGIDLHDRAYAVAVNGSYAYVAAFHSGLQIVDISNPTTPVVAAVHNTPNEALGVALLGNLACVADGNSGLQIVNVSNPHAPQLVGAVPTAGKAV
ncbi:MAG TPA: hypothetical protein VNM87_08920, partial [Candidatus Udaeobacter sp.]|nr:hypothetical protein [Candidatus Udaeobacter sp.]